MKITDVKLTLYDLIALAEDINNAPGCADTCLRYNGIDYDHTDAWYALDGIAIFLHALAIEYDIDVSDVKSEMLDRGVRLTQ